MKYTALKTATVLALAALSTQALAEPKISGRIYLFGTYENLDTKETTNGVTTTIKGSDRTKLNSSGTRIRFTGDEKLNDNLNLEYFLDYSIRVDDDNLKDGKTNNFTSRNTYLGLKHKDYGTVRAGRIYTPDDDIDYVAQGYLYADGASSPFSYHGQRTNNTIQYITPKFNNGKTQIKLHYAMDEDTGLYKEGTNNHGGSVSTLVNGKSVSEKRDIAVGHILHLDEKFDAGLAYTYAGDFNAVRGMFSYKPTKALTVGVLAQQVDYNSSDNELGFIANSYYKINDNLDVSVQAGYTDNYKGWKDGEKTSANASLIKWLKRDGTRVRAIAGLSYVDETSFKLGTGNALTKVQTDGFGVETGVRVDF